MRDRLMHETKEAMKAQNKRRLSTLRLISAALKDRDIAARVDEKGQSTGRDKITDQEFLALLQKMIKQRRDSIAAYEQAGRAELVQQEAEEIAVIEEFLPKQMGEAEVKAAIAAAVKEVGAASPKDMGKVMAALKARFTGQMDFGKASAQVKELLK
ncbi:MAG: GatB/YqeY domain-containing protein [Hyphomicrobiaceae bacterium]|nr:MAG: GatB/YqeY domain-containing protein [Hyphomicrobiaceae bacterium]